MDNTISVQVLERDEASNDTEYIAVTARNFIVILALQSRTNKER